MSELIDRILGRPKKDPVVTRAPRRANGLPMPTQAAYLGNIMTAKVVECPTCGDDYWDYDQEGHEQHPFHLQALVVPENR